MPKIFSESSILEQTKTHNKNCIMNTDMTGAKRLDAIPTEDCIETAFCSIETEYGHIKLIYNDARIGWNDMKMIQLNEEIEIELCCIEIKFDFIGIKYKCMQLEFHYIKIEHANKKGKYIQKEIKENICFV